MYRGTILFWAHGKFTFARKRNGTLVQINQIRYVFKEIHIINVINTSSIYLWRHKYVIIIHQCPYNDAL